MKRIHLFVIFAIFAVGIFDASAASQPDTNFFPLMPWNSPPDDLAVLKKMREAGFTIAGFVAPQNLDNCRKAGLKAMVSDARISQYDWSNVNESIARSNVSAVLAQVDKDPVVYGYYMTDEPSANLFPGLAKVAGMITGTSHEKLSFINLFPDYATSGQLAAPDYTTYLENYIATVHPRILCYDNYSLMDDGSIRDNYWSNLESIRAAGKSHNLDFWNIILSVAHFSYRELNAADFRFEVYTSLAYGARGICYFTYFAPATGNYRLAPIDQFGNPTANWYFLQNVNLQVQKLAPTLLQLTSDEVYHFGKLPANGRSPSTNSLISAVNDEHFMVGDFTHRDGSRYVMIVNKDLSKSHPCAPQFRKSPHGLQKVSPYSGALSSFEGEDIWLAPGQGALLKVVY